MQEVKNTTTNTNTNTLLVIKKSSKRTELLDGSDHTCRRLLWTVSSLGGQEEVPAATEDQESPQGLVQTDSQQIASTESNAREVDGGQELVDDVSSASTQPADDVDGGQELVDDVSSASTQPADDVDGGQELVDDVSSASTQPADDVVGRSADDGDGMQVLVDDVSSASTQPADDVDGGQELVDDVFSVNSACGRCLFSVDSARRRHLIESEWIGIGGHQIGGCVWAKSRSRRSNQKKETWQV